MFFKIYAMQIECFTDFNTKIVKQCLVNTEGKKKNWNWKETFCIWVHIFLLLSSCEKSQICFLLNVLYSHPVWVFSVFAICPSEIGSYRIWSIKRRGAYFIIHVKSAALIREGRLFQLRVKH